MTTLHCKTMPRPLRSGNPAFRRSALALALSAALALPASAATVSWTGASSFWDLASNWSSNPAVPGALDDVTIDVALVRTVTVRATGGPFSITSLSLPGDEVLALGGGSLTIGNAYSNNSGTTVSSGTLTLNGVASTRSLTQSAAGVVAGTGTFTVSGAASLGGTHSGTGTTVLQGNSALGSLNLDAGRTLRNEGTATLTGVMNLNPANNTGSGRIENAAGALFDVRTFNLSIFASALADRGALAGAPVFDNAGTFRKSTGGGFGVSVPFINRGSIDVQAGSFSFNDGSTHGGSVTIATGAGLILAGGTHHFNAGASFQGPGRLTLSGAGTVFNVDADTTIDSGFTQNAGTLQGAGVLTLKGETSLAINASVGVMTGTGTTRLQGTTSIANFGLDAKRVLRNEATTVIVGSIQLNRSDAAGAGRIDNAAGALLDVRTFNHSITASGFALDTGLDAALNNAGTLRKSTGVGVYGVGVAVNNGATGVVDVQAGSFNFSRGGKHDGAVTLSAGATLAFGGGTHDVNSGASFSGAGTWAVNGAGTVVNLTAPLTVRSGFSQSGGTIQGSDLTLEGATDLGIDSSLGMMTGAATTTLRGSTRIGGVNAFSLDARRVLRNEGAAILANSIQLNRTDALGAGRIENAASGTIDVQTFNLAISSARQNDLDHGRDARFDNAGLLKKTSAFNYTIGVPFFNTGTVSVEKGTLTINDTVLQAGTIRVASGATYSASGVLDNLGGLQGGGTIVAGTVSNRGVVSPGNSPGTLSIDGNFEQLVDGRLEIELGGLGDFDLLDISGSASLAGGLSVLRFGDYTPVVGDEFVILSSNGALSGSFADGSPSLSGFADGVRFGVRYDYTLRTVTLAVLAVPTPVPEPATWAMLLAGFGIVGWAARHVKDRQPSSAG